MEKEVFERRLRQATERVLDFTRRYVADDLPSPCLYLIRPHGSYEGIPPTGDEETFPDNALAAGVRHREPAGPEEAVAFLWRGGKVPNWVNVTVRHADAAHTYVELRYCGFFTAGERLYHVREGTPPFHVLSPPLPPEWGRDFRLPFEERVRKYGKFKLSAREE